MILWGKDVRDEQLYFCLRFPSLNLEKLVSSSWLPSFSMAQSVAWYDLIYEVTVCNLQLRDGRSMEEEMVMELI